MTTMITLPIVLSSTSTEQIGTLTLNTTNHEVITQLLKNKERVQIFGNFEDDILQSISILSFNNAPNQKKRDEIAKRKAEINTMLEEIIAMLEQIIP